MKRGLIIAVITALSSALAQVTPPRTAAAPASANTNQLRRPFYGALTNTPVNGNPATNLLPGTQRSPYRPALTNVPPGRRYVPNPTLNTNAPPGNLIATNRIAPRLLPGTAATNAAGTNAISAVAPANSFREATNSVRPAAVITPLQRQSMNRLIADLSAMRPGTATSPEALGRAEASRRRILINDLRLGALGAMKPTVESVTRFVDDLMAAWPAKGLTAQQRAQLGLDLSRVLNSGGLSSTEIQLVLDDARRVFEASGMPPEAVDRLGSDLLVIVNEVRPPPPAPPAEPASPE